VGQVDPEISKHHVVVWLPESEEKATKLFRNIWSYMTNVTVTSHKHQNYKNTTTRTANIGQATFNYQFVYLPVCNSQNMAQIFLLQ
jgi:hypothetical protein